MTGDSQTSEVVKTFVLLLLLGFTLQIIRYLEAAISLVVKPTVALIEGSAAGASAVFGAATAAMLKTMAMPMAMFAVVLSAYFFYTGVRGAMDVASTVPATEAEAQTDPIEEVKQEFVDGEIDDIGLEERLYDEWAKKKDFYPHDLGPDEEIDPEIAQRIEELEQEIKRQS